MLGVPRDVSSPPGVAQPCCRFGRWLRVFSRVWGPEERAAEHGAACEGIPSLWDTELLFAEMDESLRSFAEKVFASEVKDEEVKGEISHFDVEDSCPISRKEMTVHMMLQEASSTVEKR